MPKTELPGSVKSVVLTLWNPSPALGLRGEKRVQSSRSNRSVERQHRRQTAARTQSRCSDVSINHTHIKIENFPISPKDEPPEPPIEETKSPYLGAQQPRLLDEVTGDRRHDEGGESWGSCIELFEDLRDIETARIEALDRSKRGEAIVPSF